MAYARNWRDICTAPVLVSVPTHSFPNQFDYAQHIYLNPNPFTAQASAMSTPPTRTAGRKRSRNEMSEDPSFSSDASSAILPVSKRSPITPPLDASSPPGSWTEEVAERLRSSSINDRPLIDSRKSMRLDTDTAALEESTSTVVDVPAHRRTSSVQAASIDEATVALGIGWSTIPSNYAMNAASRGWARHVEKQFPLQSVKVVWQNKSMPAYLVSGATANPSLSGRGMSPGSPGYYLFNEELTQGRLVAKSWEKALDNLRAQPPVFQGETMISHALQSLMAQQAVSNTLQPVPSIIQDQSPADVIMGD